MKWSNYRKQIVFFMDLSIVVIVSMTLFLLSPVGNGTGGRDLTPLFFNLIIWVACIEGFQILFHTYDSLWRYAEGKEYMSLLLGFGCGTLLYLLLTEVFFQRQLAGLFMVATLGSSLIVMLMARFIYRTYRKYRTISSCQPEKNGRRVAIIGASDTGVSLLREIQSGSTYLPVLFLDDDPQRVGMKISDIPVKGPIRDLPELLQGTGISDLILAMPACSPIRRKEILALCTQTACRLRILPDRVSLIEQSDGGSLLTKMRNVQVEDLLGRDPIQLESDDIRPMIEGRTVLVTGGGGSIGSELCRQIAANHPRHLIIIDNYENSTYELQQDLMRQYGDALRLTVEIISVQDAARVRDVFWQHRPELVFHAAAHKHVPLMEQNPEEAVKNNVFGTLNVVNAASQCGVQKFLLISTDKAVNPTSIMGTTKRLCEMILESMRTISKTEFVAVRFGNVLGSNGSVIPLFRRQIEQGGPVTITDKRIVRYFMTIPEAVSLVLRAGAMAESSEVFVLDMGKPVRILDLAENLIRLSGYVPYEEMPIVEVGLRPGEKLYEELLAGGGMQQKTKHELIFVEQSKPIAPAKMNAMLKDLRTAADSGNHAQVFASLHRCVPEFKDPKEVNSTYLEEKPAGEPLEEFSVSGF
ncbi:MAG: nucleoside-diphosphate sugar epimerase/dehydratase [Oscillospiraceae bacterium]